MCFCPACDCETHSLLGILGRLAHLRCRNCGINHSIDAKDLPVEADEDEDDYSYLPTDEEDDQ